MTLSDLRKINENVQLLRKQKINNNVYKENEHEVIIIPAISESDKPNDVSLEEWQEYMKWINSPTANNPA